MSEKTPVYEVYIVNEDGSIGDAIPKESLKYYGRLITKKYLGDLAVGESTEATESSPPVPRERWNLLVVRKE